MKKAPKQTAVVKEYVRRLSDDDLNMVVERLTQPICGDRADVSLIFEKDKEIDKWLCQAKGAEEWFDRVDSIQDQAVAELDKRKKNNESVA
jgi:hypothetical protein